MQSKTESKSTNQCTSSSVKKDKHSFFKCLLIIKGKKLMSFKTLQDYTKRDCKGQKKCLRKTCKPLIATSTKIKNKLEKQLKKHNSKLDRKMRKWLSSKKNYRFRLT